MAIIMGFLAYIVRNALINLETIGKDIDFSFLWQAAGYDINQHLIEYTSRSSHFKAGVVGLINTY
jgi:general L-amino acid transport system permease protein